MQLLTAILFIALALYTATGAAAASRGRSHPMLPAGVAVGPRTVVLLVASALLYTVAAVVLHLGHTGPGLGVALVGLGAWAAASWGIGGAGPDGTEGPERPRPRR